MESQNNPIIVEIECPHCGHLYYHYLNYYGKTCIKCFQYIPPEIELKCVRENRLKKEALKEKAIKSVRKNLGIKENNDGYR